MQEFARKLVREPGVGTVEQYRKRVYRLARIYVGLFSVSLIGIVLLVWQGQLYVTLSQRSNVETLTLLFLLVFFGYVAVLSFPGAAGAVRIAYFRLLARLAKDQAAVERRKLQALGPHGREDTVAALSLALERDGASGTLFELRIAELWVLNCSGPQPRVWEVRLIAPSVEGAAYVERAAYVEEAVYTVEAMISNPSRGHGEVDVIFRLHSRAAGLTLQESRRVDLRPGEVTVVRAQIVAPRDSYEPEVKVNYPPP